MDERKPPAKKKIKLEEAVSQQDGPQADVKSQDEGNQREEEKGGEAWENVVVEFKFQSLETFLLSDGEMKGTLHVPMLQHPITGQFRIAPGTTEVKGVAKFCRTSTEEQFTAFFERPEGDPSFSPIQTFRLGYHLEIGHAESVSSSLINSEDPQIRGLQVRNENYFEFQTYSSKDSEKEMCQRRLNDWEANAGGMLTVYAARAAIDQEHMEPAGLSEDFIFDTEWMADYKVKLYTVLSAHSPNQKDLKKVAKKVKPKWSDLEELVRSRFPDRDRMWAHSAVENYRYFLEIKKKHKDWNSEKFSPSKAIDEVWHAHLSFPARYQYDMLAFCGHIIEHSPVLGETARDQYKTAFEEHVAIMREKCEDSVVLLQGGFYDREFWPKPQKVAEQYREGHDGDSDDCCRFPDMSSCG